jgi:LysM repeat protein
LPPRKTLVTIPQMRKTTLALLTALLAIPLTAGCFFGGGGGGSVSVQRPSSIPTATLPPKLPDAIVVGETQPNTGPTTAVAGDNTYVVKSGDTLGSIATQLGIPSAQQASWVQDVLRINGIPDATLLQAGVSLTLPKLPATPRPTGTVSGAATSVARTPTPASTAQGASGTRTATSTASAAGSATPRPTAAASTGGAGTYTVLSGDFPLLIAQKLNVPDSLQAAWANQLLSLNGIDAASLQVGQVLQLPPIPATP